MYQAIHYDDHGPMTDPCRYLRRHDLVYRRPALRPYDGVPVGTGDAGGLLYQTAYGLELTVNHADALDYAPDGAMEAWAWEAEERQTAPVSCGHLSIRSTLPIFDWVYLEAFEQRLILSLRGENDLSYTDIAAVLGVREGTVKSRLARARDQLRKKLSQSGNKAAAASSNPQKGGRGREL